MTTSTCIECGKSFTLDDRQKEWYKSRGWNLPKRCEDCRAKKRAQSRATVSENIPNGTSLVEAGQHLSKTPNTVAHVAPLVAPDPLEGEPTESGVDGIGEDEDRRDDPMVVQDVLHDLIWLMGLGCLVQIKYKQEKDIIIFWADAEPGKAAAILIGKDGDTVRAFRQIVHSIGHTQGKVYGWDVKVRGQDK